MASIGSPNPHTLDSTDCDRETSTHKSAGDQQQIESQIEELDQPVAFKVVDHLGEYDFLLGSTFIRHFDVLIDLSQNKILIRDPERRRELKRKEVIGS